MMSTAPPDGPTITAPGQATGASANAFANATHSAPPAAPGDASLAAAWRQHGAAMAAVLVLILLLYRDTAMAMVGIWLRSDTFAHAFVVPPLSLWLIWRLRESVLAVRPQSVPWLALPLAVLAAVWFMGELVSTNAVTQLMLVALIVASVPAVLGWRVAKVIVFPLGFLFFSVPVGEFLTPLLMQYTADFVVTALRLTGIPVYREGQQFIIPSGAWSVVEACSGIRYLMASLMAGTLFAYLNYRSMARRWVFVGVSIGVPIIANWLRAYIIVMLGHLSNNKIATGVDHLLYGWLFFGVVIMLMFWLGARWAQPDPPVQVPSSQAAAGGRRASTGWLLSSLALVALAVAVPPLVNQRLHAPGDARPVQLQLPANLGKGWAAAGEPVHDWQPRFLNPSATQQRQYAGPQGQVVLHVAYYRDQNRERKLVSSENVLVHSEDQRWVQVAGGVAQASTPSGPLTVQAVTLSRPPGATAGPRPKLRAWRLYWVGERFTTSDMGAKLAQAFGMLKGQGDGGALLVVYTAEDPAEAADAADARLQAFVAANGAALDQLLRGMRTP